MEQHVPYDSYEAEDTPRGELWRAVDDLRRQVRGVGKALDQLTGQVDALYQLQSQDRAVLLEAGLVKPATHAADVPDVIAAMYRRTDHEAARLEREHTTLPANLVMPQAPIASLLRDVDEED